MTRDPVIVAIDRGEIGEARRLADALAGHVRTMKVGLECFIGCGPEVVREIQDRGIDVFLDLKLHDIPNQVAGACRAITAMGVRMFTVHASGGMPMLERAVAETREAAHELGVSRPSILGVTVLTSLDQPGLAEIGVERSVADQVRTLTGLARDAGLDGVVCSPAEVRDVRRYVPDSFLVVTPGIRPKGGEEADQRRVGEPGQALRDGADFLVIGRPVTGSPDPAEALASIREGIAK
jgi:orotidine-5'-phosphate decarboxylase